MPEQVGTPAYIFSPLASGYGTQRGDGRGGRGCGAISDIIFCKGLMEHVGIQQQIRRPKHPEASQILPDFTIFVNGSSCNSLFF